MEKFPTSISSQSSDGDWDFGAGIIQCHPRFDTKYCQSRFIFKENDLPTIRYKHTKAATVSIWKWEQTEHSNLYKLHYLSCFIASQGHRNRSCRGKCIQFLIGLQINQKIQKCEANTSETIRKPNRCWWTLCNYVALFFSFIYFENTVRWWPWTKQPLLLLYFP